MPSSVKGMTVRWESGVDMGVVLSRGAVSLGRWFQVFRRFMVAKMVLAISSTLMAWEST